jgi:hypothetical protein
MGELQVEPTDFSTYHLLSAAQFIQFYELKYAGEPGRLKSEFEDFCAIELGLPTREEAGDLWVAAKRQLTLEQLQRTVRKLIGKE